MITQEELNSRILEDSDKILLIFEDYRRCDEKEITFLNIKIEKVDE